MRKVYIHTYDIFNCKDKKNNKKYLNECYKIAQKLGIDCDILIQTKTGNPELILAGPRWTIIKYYVLTLFKSDSKINGIRRIMEIIIP